MMVPLMFLNENSTSSGWHFLVDVVIDSNTISSGAVFQLFSEFVTSNRANVRCCTWLIGKHPLTNSNDERNDSKRDCNRIAMEIVET